MGIKEFLTKTFGIAVISSIAVTSATEIAKIATNCGKPEDKKEPQK